jgi:hypothetical protein
MFIFHSWYFTRNPRAQNISILVMACHHAYLFSRTSRLHGARKTRGRGQVLVIAGYNLEKERVTMEETFA